MNKLMNYARVIENNKEAEINIRKLIINFKASSFDVSNRFRFNSVTTINEIFAEQLNN